MLIFHRLVNNKDVMRENKIVHKPSVVLILYDIHVEMTVVNVYENISSS